MRWAPKAAVAPRAAAFGATKEPQECALSVIDVGLTAW